MKFKDLRIGQRFEFDHSDLTSWSGATGPWIKTGTRLYQHIDGGPVHGVGTTYVKVVEA